MLMIQTSGSDTLYEGRDNAAALQILAQREEAENVPKMEVDTSTLSPKAKKGRYVSNAPVKSKATTAALITKFISGLAAQLLPEEVHDNSSNGPVDAVSLFRVAVAALPKGKLKRALEKDEVGNVERLAAELRALTGKDAAEATPPARANKQRKNLVQGFGLAAPSAGGSRSDVVPCTVELYAKARELATESSEKGDHSLLRSLAVNPRAPVDVLIEAMIDKRVISDASPNKTDLGSVLIEMRNLKKVMVADPSAAATPSLADRMANLASVVMEAASTTNGPGTGDLDSAMASEALGLTLRMLQVSGLVSPPNWTSGNPAAVDLLADRLLLPCFQEMTGPPRGAERGASIKSLAGRRSASMSFLLAHYAAALAACSVDWEGGSNALLRSVRLAAAAAAGTAMDHQCHVGGEMSPRDESSDEGESEEDEGEEDIMDGIPGFDPLTRHLLTLCAGYLPNEESAKLDFLRCLGDACFVPRVGEPEPRRSKPLLPPTVAVRLAATCSRVLSLLPRPSASPDLSAVHFLKRAYAARVVRALGRMSSVTSKVENCSRRRKSALLSFRSDRGGASLDSPAIVQPWDFVGSSEVPPGLLDFLKRPEAPAVVGRGTAAEAALQVLASRCDRPALLVEALRSAEECTPSVLSQLLSAVEMLSDVDGNGGIKAVDGRDGMDVVRREDGDAEIYGGFFIDTGGDALSGGKEESGAMVLAPLGRGTGNGWSGEEEEEDSFGKDDD